MANTDAEPRSRGKRRFPLLVPALAVALFAAGCGSDDSSSDTKPAPAADRGGPAPSTMLGTYRAQLSPEDVPPNAPPELTDGPNKWKLTVANSGGPDGARAITLANAELGTLESSNFEVKGDRLTILNEECAAGGDSTFYDNEYSFTSTGKDVRFKTVRNQCSDKVAETLLTKNAWTKAK